MKAYFTTLDSPFAARLAALLQEKGWSIDAGNAPVEGPVELFVAAENRRLPGDDFTVRDGINDALVMASVRENLCAPIKALERLLPNLDQGQLKRICFLSGAEASVNLSENTAGFGYVMAKAAMHNALAIIKNRLRPEGYSFRLFDPMEQSADLRLTPENRAQAALTYFLTRRATEGAGRDDEDRLAMRDALGREIPY